ncbi:MAG TPA: hypothetical protein VFI74_01645 [Candidatus Saccharimonadales bacterium]|nr:hypothetical protein [Candidatus Saccharimonadales bacterium]
MMTVISIALAVLVLGGAGALVFWRRRPRQLKVDHFQKQWQEVQKMCSSRENWSQAIIDADRLLDEALKKRRIGGKNMGERMVRAQRIFTDNDSVWFGHKLRSKIETDPDVKLKEDDVKNALLGIRRALKDIGALPK